MIALTRSEVLKHGISLQTELAAGLPWMDGDRIQLQQVILNLIVNAVEAMSGVERGTRELRISTERLAAGGVLVTVRDSGPGLDPARCGARFRRPSTRRSPRAWAWASRSAVRSSRRTGDECGRARMNLGAPSFNSPCRWNGTRPFQPSTSGPVQPRGWQVAKRRRSVHALCSRRADAAKPEPLVSHFTKLAREMR